MAVDELHHVMIAGVAGERLLYVLGCREVCMVADVAHAVQFALLYPDAAGFVVTTALIEDGEGRKVLREVAECLFYPAVMGPGRWLIAAAADAAEGRVEVKLADKPVEQVVGIELPVKNMHVVVVFAMLADSKALVAAAIFVSVERIFGLEPLQCAVVYRPQPLDFGGFKQERHKFSAAAFVGNAVDVAQEMLALRLGAVPGEVLRYPLADVAGLAHIDDLAALITEIVHAGIVGQGIELLTGQIGRQLLVPGGFLQHLGNDTLRISLQQLAEQDGRCLGIAPRPVAVAERDAQRVAQPAQTVGGEARAEFAAHPHRAEPGCLKWIPGRRKVVFYKRVVEIDIVRHEYAAREEFVDTRGDLVERRAIGHEFIGNARHRLDRQRNGLVGVHQRSIALNDLPAVVDENGNLGDAAARRITARGFDIHDGVLGRCAGVLHESKCTKIVSLQKAG